MVNKRFLQIAERWKNPEVPKPREDKPISNSGLTQILQRDETGKPILQLTPMEKIAVNPTTQESYDELMRTYELGGWRWKSGDLPTQYDGWNPYKENTCIDGGVYSEGRFLFNDRDFHLKEGRRKVITTQEFYDVQNITPEMIREINIWFDENDRKKS